MLILLALIVAVMVGTLALLVLRPWLLKRQMADLPGEGRSHHQVTARGGGLGILMGLLAGVAIAFLDDSFPAPYAPLTLFVIFAVLFSLLGWADDVRSLPAMLRLGIQVLLGAGAGWAAIICCHAPVWLGVLIALAGIFYVNAANFMDGINGISGMHGLVVGGFFCALGYLQFDRPLMITAAAVSAAFAAFLPWNSPKAHMFMGDSGAYLLGATVWGMAWWAYLNGARLIVVMAPVLIYSVDVLWTLLSRAIRGKKLTDRHREHIFTQFSDKTSHLTSALVVTMATAVCSAAGLIIQLNTALFVPGALLMVGVVAAYLSLPFWMRRSPQVDPDQAAQE